MPLVPRKIGLARALSKLGYCSRAQAWKLIREGRVKLNDVVRLEPERPVNLGKDRIEVDGRQVGRQTKVYLMLNKPRDVLTTASDDRGRKTVYSCLPEGLPWVAPVGRLDRASEGLLLLTNDPEWAAQLMAPESRLERKYHVRIDAPTDNQLIASLEKGFTTKQGDYLRVNSARIVRGGCRRTWLEITLSEGRNRHIRRMFENLGIQVLRLVRIGLGPLSLGELPKGTTRPLTRAEKRSLQQALQPNRAPLPIEP